MTTPKDQWKEVDEKLDKTPLLDTKHFNDVWNSWKFVPSQELKDLFHSELEKVRQETNRKFIYELKMRLAPDNEFGEVWTMSEKERQELLDMFPTSG